MRRAIEEKVKALPGAIPRALRPSRLTSRFRLSPGRRSPVGAAPGMLIGGEEGGVAPTIVAVAWVADAAREFEVDDVDDAIALIDAHDGVWIDVRGNHHKATLQRLRDALNLHPLAIEDAWNVPQRPKVDVYDEHLYVVLDRVEMNPELRTEQISVFLGEGFVLTIQEREGDCFDPVRVRFKAPTTRIRTSGVDYVAYALVDAIIDAWFPVVEALSFAVEDLEGDVLSRKRGDVVPDLLQLRQKLHELRRLALPARDAVMSLLENDSGFIQEATMPYLRDCNDHAGRVVELLETIQEHSMGLLDVHMALSSHEMNAVMKVLTLISTIFIPLSFIAGLYGMNFDPGVSPYNMPELGWRYGYPFALGLMVAVGIGLTIFFFRKRWL